MKCPNDNTNLLMTERQGIEIDYCPECRGVWLDRGELDKIIERSNEEGTKEFDEPASRKDNRRETPRYEHKYDDDYDRRTGHHRKKRGGFLGDLFEFGD